MHTPFIEGSQMETETGQARENAATPPAAPTSTFDLYSTLKEQLVAGKYIQGSRLRADRLRHNFNCSASALREVFLRLAAEGFLEAIPQRGFRVPRTSPMTRNDLVMMRIMLEQQGVTLSIANGDVDWEAAIVSSHHKLARIEDTLNNAQKRAHLLSEWNAAELDFHQALISACGSPLLIQTHENICNRFRMHLLSDDTLYGFRDININEHREIMEAALARDSEICCQRLATHINKNLTGQSKYLLAEQRTPASARVTAVPPANGPD